MRFTSDNWAGASDRVMAALAEVARHGGPAYGADSLTKKVEERFCELFEREVAVFFVGSGTAANALALSTFSRPGAVIFCHEQAHIIVDEAGAAEFLGSGAKLVGLKGERGKLTPEVLADGLARFPAGAVHHGQPVAMSLTEITELGATYQPDEVAALAEVAKGRGVAVHMDGARFAGAIAALDVSPADLTWRAGVDVLSFGGTKNGCLAAEAVVFFDPAQARDFGFARQRIGHGFSKHWFIAAQFDAYLNDGHWLDLARQANRMGAELAKVIESSTAARLAFPPDANEIFAVLSRAADACLRAAGAVYYPWSAEGLPFEKDAREDEVMVRLVTSFQTTTDEVDRFAAVLAEAGGKMQIDRPQ
jgi:threonine aldolase